MGRALLWTMLAVVAFSFVMALLAVFHLITAHRYADVGLRALLPLAFIAVTGMGGAISVVTADPSFTRLERRAVWLGVAMAIFVLGTLVAYS